MYSCTVFLCVSSWAPTHTPCQQDCLLPCICLMDKFCCSGWEASNYIGWKIENWVVHLYSKCYRGLNIFSLILSCNYCLLPLAKQPLIWRTCHGCIWWSRQEGNRCRWMRISGMCLKFELLHYMKNAVASTCSV